jgi:hypothetical protein
MSTQPNKAEERPVVAELNSRNWAMVDELVPTDYVYHGPTGAELRSREASKLFMTEFGIAFPDFRMAIDDIIGLQRLRAMYYLLGM